MTDTALLSAATSESSALGPFARHPVVHGQVQSLLLKLPREICQISWKDIHGGHLLHVVRLRGRLLAIQCFGNHQEKNNCFHKCWGMASTSRQAMASELRNLSRPGLSAFWRRDPQPDPPSPFKPIPSFYIGT